MLRERGAYVSGEALAGRDSAAVVRPGEKPIVTDGPFAETKEALGGFYVVEVADRSEALELAGRVPASPGAAVEVLEIADRLERRRTRPGVDRSLSPNQRRPRRIGRLQVMPVLYVSSNSVTASVCTNSTPSGRSVLAFIVSKPPPNSSPQT